MSTIVLLATAWGSKHGGINVVNMELTRALAEVFGGAGRVLCVVPHAEKAEVDDAEKSGAVLVSLGLDRSTLPDFFDPGWLGTAEKKLAEAGASTVDWCIGHDAITGAAANAMKREKAAGASAVICHMSYADYQGVKHPEYPDIESKIREQRKILKAADAVIAVGPLLSNRAFNIVDRPVPMLVPGLPSIKPRPLRTQFEAVSFGRFERANDRIKQIQLAAEGLAEARRRAGEPGGPRVLRDNPTLKLIGVSKNDAESSSLRRVMQKRAKQIVNLRPMPYQQDRRELYEEIAGSSAALMLSWHEGFGLTGWEAIAAEIPLIVSEQSGLYELLYKKGLHGLVRGLRVDGSYGDDETPNFTDEDRRRVADHILEVAREPDVARGMARNLKESLISQGCTWPNAAKSMLQALGLTLPPPAPLPGSEPSGSVDPVAATATSVSSLSPMSVVVGAPTTFTVRGINLPDTLQLYIPNCTASTSTSGSSTSRSLTCMPLVAGNFIAQIKDNKGGTLLQTYVVNVLAAAPPQRGSTSQQPEQEPRVGYSTMPVGYPQLDGSPVQPAYPQPQPPYGLPSFRAPAGGRLYRDRPPKTLVAVYPSQFEAEKVLETYHGSGGGMPVEVLVGTLSADLYNSGIPQDSIVRYETALKNGRCLVVMYGLTDDVKAAKRILVGRSRPLSVNEHPEPGR